jgi:hypothetical protein
VLGAIVPHKVSEIVYLAEQGAAQASSMELKDLYSLPGELALHVANLELHLKRLEQKSEGRK